jgi:rRNA processing protein Gar1
MHKVGDVVYSNFFKSIGMITEIINSTDNPYVVKFLERQNSFYCSERVVTNMKLELLKRVDTQLKNC